MPRSSPAKPAGQFPDRFTAPDRAIMVGIVGLAFLVRLVPTVLAGGLFGTQQYDDGVYFGSALALLHGLIPYRDFLLLHPPGILYLEVPFAALSSVLGDAGAFAAVRVAFMLLGACNAGLVAVLAGRIGWRAGVLAGIAYAVLPVSVLVERTTWLIGPQVTVLVLALLVLEAGRGPAVGAPSRRRAALAGVAIGWAFSLQVWNAVPALLLLGWILLRARRSGGSRLRPAVAFVSAAAVTALVVWGPFLLAAGPRLLRYVILDQAHRSGGTGTLVRRVEALVGISTARVTGSHPTVAILALATVAALLAIAAWVVWRRPETRPIAAVAAGQLGVLALAPPFVHYAAWVAPLAMILFATAVDTAWAGSRAGGRLRPVLGAGTVGVLGVLLVLACLRSTGRRVNVAALEAALADTTCVTADMPAPLIEMNRFSRQVSAGCTMLLDPTGMAYDLDRGNTAARRNRPEFQAAIRAYYTSGDALLLQRSRSQDGLDAATWAAIQLQFPVERTIDGMTVRTAR